MIELTQDQRDFLTGEFTDMHPGVTFEDLSIDETMHPSIITLKGHIANKLYWVHYHITYNEIGAMNRPNLVVDAWEEEQ